MLRTNILLIGLLCSWVTGCEEDLRTLRIELTTSANPAGPFVAAVTQENGQVLRLACPTDGVKGMVTCQGTGLLWDKAPEVATVTIKMRGFSFIHQTWSLSELPLEDEQRVANVLLTKLDPIVDQEAYVTGFEENGLQRFQQMAYPSTSELGPTFALKFYITDLQGSPVVYFQNTKKYPLHYEFARKVLNITDTISEYEKNTYKGVDRPSMAGTLVYYANLQTESKVVASAITQPMTVNFFPSDDLTPAQAALAHRLLEERIAFAPLSGADTRVVYLPAGEAQEKDLEQQQALLASLDVPWLSRQELYGNVTLQLLNPGLAYGTLQRLSPEQLATEVVSFSDVLVLTRLPNTLPIVGGTIAEELQTPLAHVNVAARSRGTPNISLLEAGTDPRVAGLLGKLVRFEVKNGGFTLTETTLAEAEVFWKSHHNVPLVPAFDLTLEGLPSLDQLKFADAIRVGAKAANLAELAHLLQENAPHGFAIPFYYYDQFLNTAQVTAEHCDLAQVDCAEELRAQTVCEQSRTLCLAGAKPELMADYITRLLADQNFKLDSKLREAALDGIRHHLRTIPVDPLFASQLNGRVAELFGAQEIRLRSSTNAEDLATFSGAGLYESVAAYAAGDKLASDQVRKVWASVWNWRAFEERAFWNIDHQAVRMGVLVHQAFPDEMANGVLITQNIADPYTAGMYVNVQQGEVSVTNPEGGALPEVFSIIPDPNQGVQVARLRFSSLSPASPILTLAQIGQLYTASMKVQVHFAQLYGQNLYVMALDLEFKFHGPEKKLIIKQVRPYLQ